MSAPTAAAPPPLSGPAGPRMPRTDPSPDRLRQWIRAYGSLVYSAACRQSNDAQQAEALTVGAFLALAKRGPKLPRGVFLPEWLLHVVWLAARGSRRRLSVAAAPRRDSLTSDAAAGAGTATREAWNRIEPIFDAALFSQGRIRRQAFIARAILGLSDQTAAEALRTSPRRFAAHAARAAAKICGRVSRLSGRIEADELVALCAAEAQRQPAPESIEGEVLALGPSADRPSDAAKCAARALRSLAWLAWRRRFKFAGAAVLALILLLASAAFTLHQLWQRGHILAWMMQEGARRHAKAIPGLADPAQPWPQPGSSTIPAAADTVRSGADIYRTTNVWVARLEMTPAQWKAVQPTRIPPVPDFMRDGKIILRNPKAQRSGLAGVLGIDFNWTHGRLELGGRTFEDVGIRFKGNGTFVNSLWGLKRPFKIDLNRFDKELKWGGVTSLTFNNLVEDSSRLHDALAYELFRDLGVPAPRTAFAWLVLHVPGEIEARHLGLYVLVESIDAAFAKDRFGTRSAPIFKPVTYELFHDWGDDWSKYDAIYDLKTKATPEQTARVIEFAKLLSHAGDAEFAARVGEYLDLDAFSRFLAGMVLIASYDGFFINGQNFYVYLDPRSNKLGFTPWDHDHGWGAFVYVGTVDMRERASIWHPWIGEHRLLERVMRVEEFRRLYRLRLEESLNTWFVPERLFARIDELAGVIRECVAAESAFRLDRFDKAVSDQWLDGPRDGPDPASPNRPVHQIKRFITNRAASIRAQLDGQSEGVRLPGFGQRTSQ